MLTHPNDRPDQTVAQGDSGEKKAILAPAFLSASDNRGGADENVRYRRLQRRDTLKA